MKKLLLFISIVFSSLEIMATTIGSYEIIIKPESSYSPVEDEYIDYEDFGRRSLQKPIYCTLDSQNGVIFSKESIDILTYSIYDSSENCIAIFDDEFEFVSYLFTLSGEYKLVFTTPDYDLVGWIDL